MVSEPGLNPGASPEAPHLLPGPNGPDVPASPPAGGYGPVLPQQYPTEGQWLVPAPPPGYWVPSTPAALPITHREYHEFFRTPRFRWWKPLASIAMFIAGWFLVSLVVSIPLVMFDAASGRFDMESAASGELVMTPMLFLANNLSLALAIPAAGLTAWAVFGQRPRWMSSIAGGFRWGLFWRFVAVAVPILLLSFGTEVLMGGAPNLVWNADSWFLIVVIALTTPFQAAGEEYGVRGILARSVGSWFSSSRVGLVVATVVTSTVFMLLHGAGDPWLNGYYFGVGVICSLLVWKTGGLEAAIALHVVNNLIGEITLPFGGLDSLFDRQAGVAGPEILIQMFFTVALAVALLVVARRLRIPQSAAPAAVRAEPWR